MSQLKGLLVVVITLFVGCVTPGEAEPGQFQIPFAPHLTMCAPDDRLSSISPFGATLPSGSSAIAAAKNFSIDSAAVDVTGIEWSRSTSSLGSNRLVVTGTKGGPILIAVLVIDLGLDKWSVEQWAGCEELSADG